MNQRLQPTLLSNKFFEFYYSAFTEVVFYFRPHCTNHYFYK